MKNYIYNETFNDFKIGEFPYDKEHTALGEYHYVEPNGYTGNWYDPISNHQWRSLGGSWLITQDHGKHYLEQNRGINSKNQFKDLCPMLILKNSLNSEYTVEFDLRLFSLGDYAGIVFNYISSRNYYGLVVKGNEAQLYYKNQNKKEILKSVKLNISDLETYHFKIEVKKEFRFFLNDNIIILDKINIINGKCGVIGRVASRYSDFVIYMDDSNYQIHLDKIEEEKLKIEAKKNKYSKIKLIKKINLKNFGTGRQLRLTYDLDGNIIFIMAQHEKRMIRDSFAHISCLTAFDINGKIRWQIGEPNNSIDNTLISCDLPFQVSDINNDGIPELIYARNFKVIIANALNGETIKEMDTPLSDKDFATDYPYTRLNVDAIRVADFTKKGYQSDFIIKDRYNNVFAYDYDFNLLWRYNHKNTGHFPYIYDFNHDGMDEMYVGYDMVDSKGKISWSLPYNSDHTDEIIYLEKNKRLYLASGNEGFNIVNIDGSIYKSIEVGHAQRISIAPYSNKLSDDLKVCVTSFWGEQNIIYMFDIDGNLLCEKEMQTNGNVITPINYDGENIMILMSSKLGIFDDELDPVISFNEKNRPMTSADAFDIDHDGIDEILLWDMDNLYIYKASKYLADGTKFKRYSENALSNYRGEFIIKEKK